jgi:hypothetical protein
VDEGDMEDEVDNDHTLEAEDFEEGEPSATSTPRRGHLPRPLVKSFYNFNPVLSKSVIEENFQSGF